MGGWGNLIRSQLAKLLLIVSTLASLPNNRIAAQVLPAAAGAVGGLLAGTFVSTGIVVLEARLGHYMYGLDDFVSFRPEIFPMFLGPVAGGVMGATSPRMLGGAGAGVLIGATGGAIIGTGVGHLIWKTSEGRWAGGIIGGATGLLAGAIVGATRASKRGDGTAVPLASVSLRLPGGGR